MPGGVAIPGGVAGLAMGVSGSPCRSAASDGDKPELELDMWEGQFSLGGVGEGLGEGVWRQEEGVSCRKLAQEVWASQQEKEEAEQEAEDVFCNAINFTSIHVNCHISLSIPPWPDFSWRIFGFPTNFHFFKTDS